MALKEMLANDSFVDDEGEIHTYADVREELDSHPTSDTSIIQGMANLEAWRRDNALAEQDAKRMREQAVADKALQNAGVYVTLEEHLQNQRDLVDIASDLSMYRGGEKGGYKKKDFQVRYEPKAGDVEAGARANHKRLVNHDLPQIYKAAELKAAGFSSYDVDDDVTQMRSQLMSRYGGPDKKNARAKWRADLKKK